MVKSVLVVLGIFVLLLTAYVGWILYRATSAIDLRPSASATVLPDRIQIVVSFDEADSEHQITEVTFPRDFGESLGIQAPTDLTLTPYTIYDTGDPSSEESAAWVADSNQADLRWTGSVPLKSGHSITLNFSIADVVAGDGVMRFQYERPLGMGGQISFFSVPVVLTEE